jgi:hypothetical protein
MVLYLISIPAFARMYNVSCNLCHVAYPKLNRFGNHFADIGYYFQGKQEEVYTDAPDDNLKIFKHPPFAVRIVQNLVAQYDKEDKGIFLDFESPLLTKILFGGALGKNLSLYSYIVFEKGEAPFFEDAWVDIHELFNLPISITIGQFQIADLMFLRETRLTQADFYIYKLKPYPITYHRGILFGTPFFDLGVVNGNGVGQMVGNFFDNNVQKWYFGRIPLPFESGIFFLWGEEDNPYTQIYRFGFDWKGEFGSFYPFAQIMVGWDGKDRNDKTNNFFGGFLGIDNTLNEKLVLSLLFNYVDTQDSSSWYYSQRMLRPAGRISYYILRNAKTFLEVEGDAFNGWVKITTGVDYSF